MIAQELKDGIAEIHRSFGPWTYDIPLGHGVWTGGNQGLPHTRLRRVIQTAADLVDRPLAECRVLDLGCLEGIFALEFALLGASVLGVEIREANVVKAQFAKRMLNLHNVEFVQDDVRNVTVERHGQFDVVLCSGLLYHLDPDSLFPVLEQVCALTRRVAIIDTHISLRPSGFVEHQGRRYFGHLFQEHFPGDNDVKKADRLHASWGNDFSLWLTRASLVNALGHVGYSSVYECFNPAHINFGRPGIEARDRCTFVAMKGRAVTIQMTPSVNELKEDWPEECLTYPLVSAS